MSSSIHLTQYYRPVPLVMQCWRCLQAYISPSTTDLSRWWCSAEGVFKHTSHSVLQTCPVGDAVLKVSSSIHLTQYYIPVPLVMQCWRCLQAYISPSTTDLSRWWCSAEGVFKHTSHPVLQTCLVGDAVLKVSSSIHLTQYYKPVPLVMQCNFCMYSTMHVFAVLVGDVSRSWK